ncbi:MAG: protein kinase domain-containing protein [Enterovibrio sp.]
MVLPASLSRSLGITASLSAPQADGVMGIARVSNTNEVFLSAPAVLPSGETANTMQQALGAYQTPAREGKPKVALLELPAQSPAMQEQATDEPLSPSQRSAVFFQSKKLGVGAFGKVYLLTHNNRQIAFKVPNNDAARADLVKEMAIYQRVQDKLGDHPNFIRCDGMQSIDGIEGLAIEFVEGKPLSALLDAADECYHEPIITHSEYWGVMQFLMSETIHALKALESIGIAHLDIKLENILYDPQAKTIRIIDFGSAGLIEQDPVKAGTILMASPEAIRASVSSQQDVKRIDNKQDSFAVGKTVFRIGQGEHDFLGLGEDARTQTTLLRRWMSIYQDPEKAASHRVLEPEPLTLKPGEATIKANEAAAGSAPDNLKAYESEYMKFVNGATRFDSEERFSLDDLLQHPFISDPLLYPEEAPAVIEKVMQWLSARDK